MADDLSEDLVRAVATNLSETFGRIPEWDALSMIVNIDGRQFSGAGGYVYAPDGSPTPVSPKAFAIGKAVEAYLAQKYPDGEYPVALVVQYDRPSGRYAFLFEDTDRTRWKVTPDTVAEIPEKVRPHFEDSGFDVSEAIVVYLWNYPGKNDVEFHTRFGDGENLAAVRAVLDETMRAPIDMSGRTLVEIGAEVRALMHERHPELSEPALKKLGDFFTYLVK